jgi:hypothetical protein
MKARFPAVAALIVTLAFAAATCSAALAQGTVSYEKESEAAFRQQLASRQIRSAVINKRLRSLRLTLKDGRYVLAHYPKHAEPRVARELKAKGVHVTVLSKGQAESEAKKVPRHHKIRYIVGGVVIGLVVIAGAIFFIRRRRLD